MPTRSPEAGLVDARRLRVHVVGVRGFPDVEGGVETHARYLYELLGARGCEVTVLGRRPFVKRGRPFPHVEMRALWAPRKAGLEALIHSFLAVLWAGVARPDILHVHAVGPAIVVPLARFLGLRVVFTHHGPDYEREKWGAFARAVLRRGERWGVLKATRVIVISGVIADSVRHLSTHPVQVIPNGVPAPRRVAPGPVLSALGLLPGAYILHVGRMVAEKRQIDLIAAFRRAAPRGWKLCLAGRLDGTPYADRVAAEAGEDVILAGFRSGAELAELFTHAGLFALPSTHEGLPIALLEALSYGLPVVASDIPAHVEIGLPPDCYFPVGDVDALAERIGTARASPSSFDACGRDPDMMSRYRWDAVAKQTLQVYRQAANATEARDAAGP